MKNSNSGENEIRNHDTVSCIHTFQACAKFSMQQNQYWFKHETLIIALNCDQSVIGFQTQFWSQILLGSIYETKSFHLIELLVVVAIIRKKSQQAGDVTKRQSFETHPYLPLKITLWFYLILLHLLLLPYWFVIIKMNFRNKRS